MSTDQNIALVPQWTQGDRLRKARTLTGMTVREFAEHIGVSHGTITNAETDSRAVRPITLKAWALATGVSQEWLERGISGSSSPTPPNAPTRAPKTVPNTLGSTRRRGRNGDTRTTHEYVPAA